MTTRAIEIFNGWCGENINPLPFPEHNQAAQKLALEFGEDAKRAGLTGSDLKSLEEEFLGQDLVSEIKDRLDSRTNEEIAAARD